jgi:acyl-CoA synthetase (AMP-forming)/AMP-acid ligase II
MAALLARRWVPKPGDHVAIHLWNGQPYATVFFALMKLGVVAVLLNPRSRARELRAALLDLPVRGVVTSSELAGVWDEAGDGKALPVLAVDDLLAELADGRPPRVAADGGGIVPGDQAAVILCTSGTTGAPKRVVRSHQGLLANAGNVVSHLAMGAGAKILSVIPFAHANGFSNCFFAPLLSGTTLCLMKQFDPSEAAALVEREKIGFLPGSPFVFIQLLPVGRGRLSSVKTALSSGAPLPPEIRSRCRDELGLEVRQLYGSSETGTVAIESAPSATVDGCLGRPLPGVEVAILDASRRPLPVGEVGEIVVRSPAMMSGYWEAEGLSRAGFDGDFFRMGDLGCLDQHGCLLLRGRAKRMINVAGLKVDPEEIAQVIRQLPEVGGCRVVGLPHPIQTEIVAATVWLRAGAELTRMALMAHCRRFLAEHKLPRHIVLTDEPVEAAATKTLVSPKELA